jgi:hypothetical protein
VDQLTNATGERIRELHGTLERVTRQINHDARAEGGNPSAELSTRFFNGSIDHDVVDSGPALVGKVRLILTPRDAHRLVSATDESRHQIRPDVARTTDDDNTHAETMLAWRV